MSLWRIMAGLGALAIMLASDMARAQNSDADAGKMLYQEHCSTCHGMIAPETTQHWPALSFTRVALATAQRMVVAPPYGPPLRGVYGRQAGRIAGFNYSRAFRQRLQGVVWNRETLDTWITDSQAWVPGSLMFYKQPDPEIRRQILTYLEATR